MKGTVLDCLQIQDREVALRMRTTCKYRDKKKKLNDSCKYLRLLAIIDAAFLSSNKLS